MNITVYLGANPGRSPVYGETAAELGRLIGRRGDTLVYGGSRTGRGRAGHRRGTGDVCAAGVSARGHQQTDRDR